MQNEMLKLAEHQRDIAGQQKNNAMGKVQNLSSIGFTRTRNTSSHDVNHKDAIKESSELIKSSSKALSDIKRGATALSTFRNAIKSKSLKVENTTYFKPTI
jgi:hypothetical protein